MDFFLFDLALWSFIIGTFYTIGKDTSRLLWWKIARKKKNYKVFYELHEG